MYFIVYVHFVGVLKVYLVAYGTRLNDCIGVIVWGAWTC